MDATTPTTATNLTTTAVDVNSPDDATSRTLSANDENSAVDKTRNSTSGQRNSSGNENAEAEKSKPPHASTDSNKDDVADPNVVDWDGPNDPANPRNWSKAYKFINISLISASVLYVNLATTMFAPGANLMQRDFGFKSQTVEILTITIASVGFAIGSLFVAPLSEVFGRIPVYRVTGIFYMGFTVGCSRSTQVAEFLIFRLLTGLSASSYMTTGGGTVADLLPKEERGAAMAIFAVGPLLGPVVGPIVGGFVTQDLSWRWTFYLILILAGAVTIPSYILMRETSFTAILRAKTARLRKETGNPNLRAAGDSQIPFKQHLFHSLTRPTRFLTRSPIVLLVALYMAFIFAVMMLFFATFPTVFENVYHWSVGVSGLGYIGVGVGCAIGVVLFAKLSDRLLKTDDGKVHPERRLILMMYTSPLVPAGLFIYGWTTEYKIHWVVPIIGTAITGVGVVTITSCCQTYIIDIFGPQTAASALSAITVLRNMTGGFLPIAAAPLYENLGLGWGNSVLAFISTAFIAVPFFFYWRGEWLRLKFPVKI